MSPGEVPDNVVYITCDAGATGVWKFTDAAIASGTTAVTSDDILNILGSPSCYWLEHNSTIAAWLKKKDLSLDAFLEKAIRDISPDYRGSKEHDAAVERITRTIKKEAKKKSAAAKPFSDIFIKVSDGYDIDLRFSKSCVEYVCDPENPEKYKSYTENMKSLRTTYMDVIKIPPYEAKELIRKYETQITQATIKMIGPLPSRTR